MRRVVIAHDYLTQAGGAERVVLALAEAFPNARIITSAYSAESTFPEFREREIETLLSPRLTAAVPDIRLAFPLLARAFSRADVRDADLVLCSSSGWSHGLGTNARKIVYCHTPARWLYEPADYFLDFPKPLRRPLRLISAFWRRWDRHAAESADEYIANSSTVRTRILRAYGRDSTVIHPPSTLDEGGEQTPVSGVDDGFLLTVARPRGYKNTSAICEAAKLAKRTLVIVGAASEASRTGGILNLGRVTDAELRWLYAHSSMLVAASYEDFGLTPVEAMTFGKPIVALRAGGYLDSVQEGVTGMFFDSLDPKEIASVIELVAARDFNPSAIRSHAANFSRERFVSRIQDLALSHR